MPTMHDSNEGQTQYVTDTQEAMQKARPINGYGVASMDDIFDMGFQSATAQSAEKIANDAAHIKQLETGLDKAIEKIARLEAELDAMNSNYQGMLAHRNELKKQLAAAELSNKQLREEMDTAMIACAQGVPQIAREILRAALAQQPSTEALEAYVANFNPWISVKTKLPDNRQEVLARETDGCIYELRFIQERDESCTYNSWYDCDGNRYGDIAHWMTPPPAPEKE